MNTRRPHTHLSLMTVMGLALVLAALPTGQSAHTMAAQAGPRIAYPRQGAVVPGPDVALAVVGGAVDVGGFQVIVDGEPILDAAPAPIVLRGLLPGDHAVSLVANDGSAVLETTFTSLPEATAALREGICDATKPEAAADLGILSISPEPAEGEAQGVTALTGVGVPLAVPVAHRTTTIPLPLADILERAHAITVELPEDAEGTATTLVCGAIGGSARDGVLRIGLSPLDDALAYGIATLTASDDETIVTVELVQTDAAPQTLTGIDPLPGEAGPLPSGVRQGVCSALASEVSFDLEDLGEVDEVTRDELPTGVPLAIPVLTSETTIGSSLDDLLARAFSLQASAIGLPDIADETLVTCGEVGGVPVGETLRVALLAANISGYVGTASLTGTDEGTEVVINVVRGGLASDELPDIDESEPEAGSEAAEDPTAGPADEGTGEVPAEPVIPEEPVTPAEPPVEPEPTFDPGPPVATQPPPPVPTQPPPIPTEPIPVPTEPAPPPTVPVVLPTAPAAEPTTPPVIETETPAG